MQKIVNFITLYILIGIVSIISIVGLFIAINNGMDKSEYSDCLKWQSWEEQFPAWDEKKETGYYILQWQHDQCEAHGVYLDAHVLTTSSK